MIQLRGGVETRREHLFRLGRRNTKLKTAQRSDLRQYLHQHGEEPREYPRLPVVSPPLLRIVRPPHVVEEMLPCRSWRQLLNLILLRHPCRFRGLRNQRTHGKPVCSQRQLEASEQILQLQTV